MIRLLRIGLIALATSLVAMIALFIVLTSIPGQRGLLRLVEYVASNAESRVKIGPLDGSLLSSGEIRSLSLYDAEGRWLEIKSIRFAWHPLALLGGRLDIDELTAEEILVERRTASSDGDTKKRGGLPMVRVALDRLELRRVILRAPVLGEEVEFSAAARVQMNDAPLTLQANVDIERLDVLGSKLSGTIRYRPHDDSAQIRLHAEETAGGVIGQLAQVPGQPALKLALNGDGPLSSWRAAWHIEADGQRIAQGDASINRADQGHDLAANMDGALSGFVPPAYADLLAGHTRATFRGKWLDRRAIEIFELSVRNDALQLRGEGSADPQRSNAYGNLSLTLRREDGAAIAMPLGDDRTITLGEMAFELHLPQSESGRQLTGKLDVEAMQVRGSGQQLIAFAQGIVSISAVEPEPGNSLLPEQLDNINLAVNLKGLTSDDPAIANALGPGLNIEGDAVFRDNRLSIDRLTAALAAGTITVYGTTDAARFDGTLTASVPDLSRLSGITKRDLSGSAEFTSNIKADFDASEIALSLDGRLNDTIVANEIVDRLLTGETAITGGISRNGKTVTFDELTVANPQFNIRIDGEAGSETTALRLEALAHAQAIDSSLSGDLVLNASIDGEASALRSSIALEPRGMTIRGKPLHNALAKFSGEGSLMTHSGKLSVLGDFEQHSLKGGAAIAFSDDGAVKVDDIALSFGSATTSGKIRFAGGSGVWGNLHAATPDLSEFAALLGASLAGQLDARLNIASWSDAVALKIEGHGVDLAFGPSQIGRAEFSANVADVTNRPRIAGNLTLSHMQHEQFKLSSLSLVATDDGAATAFILESEGPDLRLSSSGKFAVNDKSAAIALQTMKGQIRGIDTKLLRPAQIEFSDGAAQINDMSLNIGGGRIDIGGRAGEILDLRVELTALPAKVADAFAPQLAASGTIDGSTTISGNAEAPQADYKISWQNITADPLREASAPPLDGKAQGKYRNGVLEMNASVAGQGIEVTAIGTVVPAGEGRLQLSIKGNLPLSLVNAPMAARGLRAEGDLQLNMTVQGSFAATNLSGIASLRDGKLYDPESGVKLHAIAMSAKLSGGALLLENVEAQSEDGGTLSGSGNIKQLLDGKAIADLALILRDMRIEGLNGLQGQLNGDIQLKGDLMRQPTIAGEIKIVTLEVPIPDQLPSSLKQLDLKHINPPAQLREILPESDAGQGAAPVFSASIDLSIDAGNRIFVRGRGLTAQLGGNLKIRGTSNAPTASGAFQLERGKLAILGREIDFTRGNLQFAGSLDPYLDFAATTKIENAQVTILISGQASDPQFRFTSSPDLPEDEILSRLLFNKSLAKLSAVQIAKLAAEVDKIGGLSGGAGMVDRLRNSLGVDVLDVTANDKGEASVTAGSYLQDNAYVGIEQGTGAESSRIIIDLDITGNLKARGEVGANGESKLGVGMEWDY